MARDTAEERERERERERDRVPFLTRTTVPPPLPAPPPNKTTSWHGVSEKIKTLVRVEYRMRLSHKLFHFHSICTVQFYDRGSCYRKRSRCDARERHPSPNARNAATSRMYKTSRTSRRRPGVRDARGPTPWQHLTESPYGSNSKKKKRKKKKKSPAVECPR